MNTTESKNVPGPRLSNQAWEGLLRVQVQFMREFSASHIWKNDLSITEYDVLYTLSKAGADGLTQRELNQHVLLAQSSLSRLTDRLMKRGFLRREPNPDDARSIRIQLTDTGREKQREIGLKHGKHVHEVMSAHLDAEQMQQLRELTHTLLGKLS